MKGRVLIIAGSDSGGGAGIQADIKAVSAMGAFAATAVTAITAQNTQGVFAVEPVSPSLITQQIRVVLDDLGTDVIKLGMVGSVATGEAILEGLTDYSTLPLVLDPVMVATSGDRLGDPELVPWMLRSLVPRVHVVTPNLPELELLTGDAGFNSADTEERARHLLALGARAVLAKGGHAKGDTVRDQLFIDEGAQVFEAPRLETPHTHGTGCTLASALAAGLAQGMSLEAATDRAIRYVQAAIKAAPSMGRGHGPVNHLVWQDQPS